MEGTVVLANLSQIFLNIGVHCQILSIFWAFVPIRNYWARGPIMSHTNTVQVLRDLCTIGNLSTYSSNKLQVLYFLRQCVITTLNYFYIIINRYYQGWVVHERFVQNERIISVNELIQIRKEKTIRSQNNFVRQT